MNLIAGRALQSSLVAGALLALAIGAAFVIPALTWAVYAAMVIPLEVLEDRGMPTLSSSDGWPVPTALGLAISLAL